MSSNRLSRIVGKIQQLPTALQSPALSLLFGSQVKFAGTAKGARTYADPAAGGDEHRQ